MMNQIKELKNKNNKSFIIDIIHILVNSEKNITVKIKISLSISAPLTVLELKEFISNDFGFPIKNMIFFYPLNGIIENSYKFSFEPNKKILLILILDQEKSDTNKINNEIDIKNKNFLQFPNFFKNNIFYNKNNINNLINNLKNNKNIKIENIKLNNSIKDNKEDDLNKLQNNAYFKNTINDIGKSLEKINKSKDYNNMIIKNNISLNQQKNSKCNFVLTKVDNKQNTLDENLLGKKRCNPMTFKTTILNKENENTKSKNLIKLQTNNNIKIVNFSVNKNLINQNIEDKEDK